MRLDPKGLKAAKGVMRSSSGILIMGEAFNATMEAAINAYLEAAPSPSPAPGVVEALRKIKSLLSFANQDNVTRASAQSNLNAAWWQAHNALASLSQPAKGEREGGGA